MRRRFLLSAAILTGLRVTAAHALDNPDAADATAAFVARERPLQERWTREAGGPGQADAGAAYLRFLDAELNDAYRTLLAKLDGPSRQALQQSQRRWLAFRDAERRFIARSWTAAQFGSSAALSRLDYRASLDRQRVLALLAYRQNFPGR